MEKYIISAVYYYVYQASNLENKLVLERDSKCSDKRARYGTLRETRSSEISPTTRSKQFKVFISLRSIVAYFNRITSQWKAIGQTLKNYVCNSVHNLTGP